MSIITEAKKLLSEYDSQTPVGKFAQSVLDYFEEQLTLDRTPEGPFSLTKVSKNLGATEVEYAYEGTFNHKPKVGESFQFFYDNHVIHTSIVKEVNKLENGDVEIKTLNSIYILKQN